MELLHKNDIEILDMIIDTCITKGQADVRNLPDLKSNFLSDIPEFKKDDYKYYFSIIDDSGKAEVKEIGEYQFKVIRPYEIITKRFVEDGGFKKLYEDQQRKKSYELIIEKGNLASATNSIWTKKTYWWTFGIAIAGFVIGLIALVLTITKS